MALFGLLGNETFELSDMPQIPVLATRRIGADFSVVTILAAASGPAAAEESLFVRLPKGTDARLERYERLSCFVNEFRFYQEMSMFH